MPKVNIDYSKIVIYKIVCNDLAVTDTYVGSTINFVQRKSNHKGVCNKKLTKYIPPCDKYFRKVYVTIRANGGWDNWTMVEIEKYPCKDSNESTSRERYWYEQYNCKNMNSLLPNKNIG